MVRPHTQLHPSQTPAALRPAATVLLLRDGSEGLQVLMTRRSMQASFAPGAYVFPGGAVDPQDHEAAATAGFRPGHAPHWRAAALAAIRECYEELGILLAYRADGQPAQASDVARLRRDAPFYAQCQALGLRPAADATWLLAHWITDRDLPKRFDVPFWVARMPVNQEPVADEQEQFEPAWVSPADALARHAQGAFNMVFPTVRTLQRLQLHTNVEQVLQACAGEQPLFVSCPRAGLRQGKEARFMEHEPPYGELALVCPDGQIVHHLDWQHQRPVPLLRHVQRLTVGNPGMMTGPGTNTYVVGEPDTGYVVIDPGPDDAAHRGRLLQATQGDIRAIVCTHSHPDHSPGARPLQAALGTPAPVLGLPSGPHARADSRWSPDEALSDGATLRLGTTPGNRHTLRALHTPGHAANHVCLVLEEDGLLFSGDHILNGSTTVIAPPDGNMDDYLDSLQRLAQACQTHAVQFILPAHGHALHQPLAVIAGLRAHRLAREAKVAQAMHRHPNGGPDDWLALAYDDTPKALWPVARHSLLAHVQRLQRLATAKKEV